MDNKKTITLFNYIGGKSWLRIKLREEISKILNNNKINTYVEPFAGSLGAFLSVYDILLSKKIKTVILSDINGKLINFYNVVKNHHENLIQEYMLIEREYKKLIPKEAYCLHKTKDKADLKILLKETELYYKSIRDSFNKQNSEIISAAKLLFLQNHCFNGIYRENSTGGYNTPFNWEVKIYTEEKIREKVLSVYSIFNLFDISFVNKSFLDIEYNENSLYYLDPPYINEEVGENKYNKDIFTVEQQILLINKIKNTTFVYSNHKSKILEKEFLKLENINTKEISRKNIMSSNKDSRKEDKIELLINTR